PATDCAFLTTNDQNRVVHEVVLEVRYDRKYAARSRRVKRMLHRLLDQVFDSLIYAIDPVAVQVAEIDHSQFFKLLLHAPDVEFLQQPEGIRFVCCMREKQRHYVFQSFDGAHSLLIGESSECRHRVLELVEPLSCAAQMNLVQLI